MNSVNTVDKEAQRCKAKPIILVVLIQGSKAKEEREKKRAESSYIYKKQARAKGPRRGPYRGRNREGESGSHKTELKTTYLSSICEKS
jgi:hypothetical protein